MAEEKFTFARHHLTKVLDSIEDEQVPEDRSALALQILQYLLTETGRHLTVDARTEIRRTTENLLKGGRNEQKSRTTSNTGISARPGDSSVRSGDNYTGSSDGDNDSVSEKSTSDSVMLAYKNLKQPLWNLSPDIDGKKLARLRDEFFKEITSIPIKCKVHNAAAISRFNTMDAASLTNVIFDNVLGPGIKVRMRALIDICNGQKASRKSEKTADKVITLSRRQDFPRPLRQFLHLAAAKEHGRKFQPTHLDDVKSVLGYYALWTRWEKIRDLAKQQDPYLERIFEENDLYMGQGIDRVSRTKQLLIKLLQTNNNSLQDDLKLGQCLAQMIEEFGIGIVILFPKRSLYIFKRCTVSKLAAAWPILKRWVPSLENIAQMACQKILRPMIHGEKISLVINCGKVKCVEDVFSPADLSCNIGSDSQKPHTSMKTKAIQRFLVGDITDASDPSEYSEDMEE